MPENFSGRRVGILGMGRSGIGAARLVKRLGGNALISDRKDRRLLTHALDQLEAGGIEVECGTHERLFGEDFDIVILSPGAVLPAAAEAAFADRSIPLWSELELASRCCECPWIGVTGSNGKTTTVTLLTEILNQAGLRAKSAGNIGSAWSEHLPETDVDVFVIEVSSFQMEHSSTLRPKVGVILNVLENHLDRHGTMEIYGALKLKLLENQQSSDFAVLNADDRFLAANASGIESRKMYFGFGDSCDWIVRDKSLWSKEHGTDIPTLESNEWDLLGTHNLLNAAAAACAATSFGVSTGHIRDSLLRARPVEHRIELVCRHEGVLYVNDSKSTNLTATLTALNALEGKVVLLFGGRPKLESFSMLSKLLHSKISTLITFGEARAKVRQEVGESENVCYVAGLAEALNTARQHTTPGTTILLSPGCASFDQYDNYEERGKHFKSLVHALHA
ncbi:MAG: UDP-N-acetylmuramoyl-L-alanine--D-glutamate ligase [Calditrichaeota bacterium]|nr:UDP-N-acetylmuramoyl-L-alanine--D-glutamate ligase [Calditrichota bacterium]MCB9391062.1 UDP-N-acetylmuramoyl-L-alanine--D-glutamate ligase [Calditrichota bacterium]